MAGVDEAGPVAAEPAVMRTRRPPRPPARGRGPGGRGFESRRSPLISSGLAAELGEFRGALGLAVLTAVATGRTDAVAGKVPPAVAVNEGFQAGLLVAAGIVVVGLVVSAIVSLGSRPAPAAASALGASHA